jgi:hypothetical protein
MTANKHGGFTNAVPGKQGFQPITAGKDGITAPDRDHSTIPAHLLRANEDVNTITPARLAYLEEAHAREITRTAVHALTDHIVATAPEARYLVVRNDNGEGSGAPYYTADRALDRDGNTVWTPSEDEAEQLGGYTVLLDRDMTQLETLDGGRGVKDNDEYARMPMMRLCGIDGCRVREAPRGGSVHKPFKPGHSPHCTCSGCY